MLWIKIIPVVAVILLAFACKRGPGVTDIMQAKDDFEILKYNNPDAIADLGVGLWAWPLPMDFDDDGDMDLLVSCPDKPFNGTYFFENKSGDAYPVFEPPVRLTHSIKDVQLSYVNGEPRVLVPGFELANFRKALDATKSALFPVDSILKDFTKRPRFNQWKLVDFDGDDDEDIVVGVDDWTDYGWDNAYDDKGNWTNGPLHGYLYLIEQVDGEYINRGRIQAGGKPIDVYGAPSPNFADFDGDGDLDIICGEFLDRFTWFENTGSRERPVYAKGKFLENESGILKMDLEMIIPVAVDWNADGFIDLVVGDEDGRVALVENSGLRETGLPVFKSPVYFKQRADNVKFGALATPVGVDWDNDGDEDIVTGNSAGYIAFIENVGMKEGMPVWSAPVYLESEGEAIRVQAGRSGSIQGPAEAKWGYTAISVADWDGDARKDIVVNSIWGKVVWFRNVGDGATTRLSSPYPVKVDWKTPAIPRPQGTWWDPEVNSLATQWRTTPYAVDWNKDGVMDLVMLDHEGYLSFFEGFRKEEEHWLRAGRRVFEGLDFSGYDRRHEVTDSIAGPLRLNSDPFGRSGRRKFTIADWNLDGKPDLLVNSVNVSLLAGTASKKGRTFFKNAGNVGQRLLAGHTTSPTTVDWNKDGKPDLLVGAEDGHFYYLVNPHH